MNKRIFVTSALLLCCALIAPEATGAAAGAVAAPRAPQVVGPPGLPESGAQFGAYVAPDCYWTGCDRQVAQLTVEQEQAHRLMEVDRQFYQWDEDWPNADDVWSAQGGRTPIISWNAASLDGVTIAKWADIASGVYDATLHAQATKIKAFPYPFWFVFNHEPTNKPPGGTYGTAADFVAAWRHIHDVFDADGVTNIRYLLVMFALSYSNGAIDDYYPGDRYVDAVGSDGYNWYQCGGQWKSFTGIFKAFHNWGLAHQKTMIIAEWGTGEDPADPLRKAAWITDALNVMKGWPDIKIMAYFDTGKNPLCLRWLTTPDNDPSGPSATSFAQIGTDPWVNPGPDTMPPTTTVKSGPPGQTLVTTATLTWAASELGVRYQCRLDAAPFAPCYDFQISYTGLALGGHSFQVQATDYSGNIGTIATWPWAIANPTFPVSIGDGGFVPSVANAIQGQSLRWTAAGTLTHQISDTSGMGLFGSGVLSAGQSYSFTFVGAGKYAYQDALHTTNTGSVSISPWTVPTSGGVTTSFTVNWASAAPPTGFVFDVKIKRPGQNFKTWRNGTAATSGTFVPDTGIGTYQFQARIRKSSNGTASSYSPVVSIIIS